MGTFYLTVPTFTFATRTNGRTPDAYDEPPPTTLSLSFSFNLSLLLALFPSFLFLSRPSSSSRCASAHACCLYRDCLAVHTYAHQPYKSRICRVTYIRESAFYVGTYMRKGLNRAFEIWPVTPGCRALEPVTVLPQFRPQSQNTVSRGRVRREPLDCTKKNKSGYLSSLSSIVLLAVVHGEHPVVNLLACRRYILAYDAKMARRNWPESVIEVLVERTISQEMIG